MEEYVDSIEVILSHMEDSEEDLIFQLGIALQHEYKPAGVEHGPPFKWVGEEFWEALQYELSGMICVDQKPKGWVKELIEGDVRNLAVGIAAAICSRYDVTLGIAVPASALVLKKKVEIFCRQPMEKPERSVQEILRHTRDSMRK